jgi:hypothetical protein
MADKFDLKALISMVDRMSPGLKAINKNVNAMRRTFLAAGKDGQIMGAGLVAGLAIPAKLFADAESAGIDLKNALLDKNGVAGGFDQLMTIATQLGNVLPGNTADFAKMATVMRSNSVATQDMIDGGLKAAAYLGVLVKDTDGAAQGLAKLSNVFGIAGKDLVGFADTAQRVTSLGVPLEDFVQAMSKAGGPLKAVGAQGLAVANSVAPLVALLTQAGIQADEAGTGVKTMIMEFAKSGKFTTIENMVKDLEKMKKLDPVKLLGTFEKAFGKEHASKALIVAAGGYDELAKKMANMASMDQKINNQLGGLTAIFDAMTGTIQNAGAALGMVYAPELKAAAQWVNVSADAIRGWIGENGPAIKIAIEVAAGVVGMKLAFLAAAGAMGVLNTVMKANPWMALVQGLLIAAPLIYSNFDKIVDYVSDGMLKIEKTLTSIKDFFSFNLFDGNSGGGMRPPGYTKNIVGSNKVSGGIDVNFNNAPSGMRVAPAHTKGPVSVTPNVGYRTIGTAAGG